MSEKDGDGEVGRRRAAPSGAADHFQKHRMKKIRAESAVGLDEAHMEEKHFLDQVGDVTEDTWRRPPLERPVDPNSDAITFQQCDMDYTLTFPLAGMPGLTSGVAPLIRIYGVTEKGHSVCCKVHGVLPYFYIAAPKGWTNDKNVPLRESLNRLLEASGQRERVTTYCLSVETVKKAPLNGFFTGKFDFLKITLAVPKHVPTCRGFFEHGAPQVPGHGPVYASPTYESNIPFVLRYMIDAKIGGGSWIELPVGKYRMTANRISTAQIEVDVAWNALVAHPAEGEWSKIAPLRVLSFDIECAGPKDAFPQPEKDPVIQIANLVSVQGESKPMIRNIFTLRGCSSIVGAQVLSYQNEKLMLEEWSKFISECDPDIIIGYNINNFDLPYLFNRAKKLGAEKFYYFGRIRETKCTMKDSTFSSKAYGTRESHAITSDGRVFFDVMQIIQRDYKLRSYSLNAVSAEFLGQQKEDVHHSIISDLFNGSDDDRRRLAVYCLKDAYLPQRLLDKLMCLINYIEMARVTGVPLSFLLSRGQQIKVVSQLYRHANAEDLLIPTTKHEPSDDQYEGATVLEPIKGFYQDPITTLDFSSLYPSIMIAHNLCYTTLLSDRQVKEMTPEQWEKSPLAPGDPPAYFARASVREGLLPRILKSLLAARAKAKDDLKKEKDPFKKAVLDGRQNALKISANSVYGFTGATVGQLPCIEISASVTAYGREMIETTKRCVEEKYTVANGYKYDAQVIYGDTDSVLIKFGSQDLSYAMELGKEAAKFVTERFPRPINLLFEKVYWPFLLITKKRYAGLLWTKPDKWDKMDAKGIETVRRDNCPLVRNVITTCLHKILIDRDVEGAKAYAKGMISDLLTNKLDLSLLVITKALSRKTEDYAAKQAHVELAERMRKRNPGTAPAMGDRVPYVIIQAAKNARAYEKAEDPLWVLENNIPLDAQYYLEQQLQKPLERLFEPLMKDVNALFTGEHTRSIQKSTPSAAAGGIVQFTQKRLTCLSCRAPLSGNDQTVCAHCKPREAEVFVQQLATLRSLEGQFSQAWTQCQRCQGSLHQTVLCTSRDCPIFYRRMKIKKDLNDVKEIVERWNNTEW